MMLMGIIFCIILLGVGIYGTIIQWEEDHFDG